MSCFVSACSFTAEKFPARVPGLCSSHPQKTKSRGLSTRCNADRVALIISEKANAHGAPEALSTNLVHVLEISVSVSFELVLKH